MARLVLFEDKITDTYKTTSDAIKNVKLTDKLIIRKSLVDMMRESFFRGSNKYGYNFIA
ncbi:MAG: hypothetical protein LKG27_02850 [Clostridiaceae bacterium]|jgi:hypothetical protein|nr:hypothetical protein [Clostridiaceae bacterium]